MFDCALDESVLARTRPHADFLSGQHDKARDVHRLAVHFDVAMPYQLARRLPARREPEAIDHVIQPAFQRGQKVMASDTGQRRDVLERVPELLLGHAVNPLDLLLLAELLGVFGCLATASGRLAMLARRIWTAFHRALLGEALRSLQEQLRAFAAALTATGSRVAHGSDSPALWGTAAVMRNRCHVLDRLDLESGGGKRLDGGL